MLMPCYQYAINEMNAVSSAIDCLNRYLGQLFVCSAHIMWYKVHLLVHLKLE